MDITTIIALAQKAGLPCIAGAAVDVIASLAAALPEAGDVLTSGERADIEAAHAHALAANAAADAALATAELR